MNDLFLVRVLTAAVNAMKAPARKIYNRLFAGKENSRPSELLEFDIITGSEKILKNISIYAPAEVREKTGRKTVIMKAPRLAEKRFIPVADLSALRNLGEKIGLEQMKNRIAREQLDMKNEIDRTMEFWAANALKGKILDSDLTTVLVDYNLPVDHKFALTGSALWSDVASDPIAKIREFKTKIEEDSGAAISGWLAFLGSKVMDALLKHDKVRDLLKAGKGVQIAESGRIETLCEVELVEYNGSFLDDGGVRRRFIAAEEFLLIGLCDDLVNTPFAPIVDLAAPGGVGNVTADGQGVLYFSKSWEEEDPSGTWIKVESRPLPVLQRPGALMDVIAVA